MNTEIQCVQSYDNKIKKLCAIGHRGGNAWEPSLFVISIAVSFHNSPV